MNKIDKVKERRTSLTALIIILLIILIVILTGCSKSPSFKTYSQSVEYCYNQNITESCGIEKCILLNSADFSDSIRFSAEKNYYQCKLIECGESK